MLSVCHFESCKDIYRDKNAVQIVLKIFLVKSYLFFKGFFPPSFFPLPFIMTSLAICYRTVWRLFLRDEFLEWLTPLPVIPKLYHNRLYLKVVGIWFLVIILNLKFTGQSNLHKYLHYTSCYCSRYVGSREESKIECFFVFSQ